MTETAAAAANALPTETASKRQRSASNSNSSSDTGGVGGNSSKRAHWKPDAGNVAVGEASATSMALVEAQRSLNDGVYEMLYADDANDRALNRMLRTTLALIMKTSEWQCMETVARNKIQSIHDAPTLVMRQQKIAIIFCAVALFENVKLMIENFVPAKNRVHFPFFVDIIVLPAFVRFVKGQNAYDVVATAAAESSSSSANAHSRSTAEREICYASSIARNLRGGGINNRHFVVQSPSVVRYAPLMTLEIFVMLIASRYPRFCGIYTASEPPEHTERVESNARIVLQ